MIYNNEEIMVACAYSDKVKSFFDHILEEVNIDDFAIDVQTKAFQEGVLMTIMSGEGAGIDDEYNVMSKYYRLSNKLADIINQELIDNQNLKDGWSLNYEY